MVGAIGACTPTLRGSRRDEVFLAGLANPTEPLSL
jgi:hypothetical protein